MARRAIMVFCVSLSGVPFVACSSSSSPNKATSSPSSPSDAGAGVTFHKDVEPITQRSCLGCHAKGGIAPFALAAYADAKAHAELMVARTASGAMPPWGAVETPECTPRFKWKNDVRLTSAEIATIKAWHDQGDVEGDPRDAPAQTPAQPPVLSGATLEIAPPPYSIKDAAIDQFRCFVLDPKFTATNYVNGSFIVPGNATIVHHALIFADPGAESTKLITDPATNSYDCFGGPGLSNTSLVSAWAPGGLPIEYPAEVGAPLAAGTLLVMQVHYHPHSATAVLGPDQTKIQLRLTSSAPTHLAAALLVGNFNGPAATTGSLPGTGLLPGPNDPPSGPVFDIPPGVTGHTETMQITVPSTLPPIRILGLAGHEHYVGTAVDITIARQNAQEQGAPANECLLSIPAWDFNWQRFYSYDTPLDQLPTAMPGDVVQIKCTYDNTLGNSKVVASLADRGLSQPQDVKLGETTLDEMCLGAFIIIQ